MNWFGSRMQVFDGIDSHTLKLIQGLMPESRPGSTDRTFQGIHKIFKRFLSFNVNTFANFSIVKGAVLFQGVFPAR